MIVTTPPTDYPTSRPTWSLTDKSSVMLTTVGKSSMAGKSCASTIEGFISLSLFPESVQKKSPRNSPRSIGVSGATTRPFTQHISEIMRNLVKSDAVTNHQFY